MAVRKYLLLRESFHEVMSSLGRTDLWMSLTSPLLLKIKIFDFCSATYRHEVFKPTNGGNLKSLLRKFRSDIEPLATSFSDTDRHIFSLKDAFDVSNKIHCIGFGIFCGCVDWIFSR
jgi:hypothetical protein